VKLNCFDEVRAKVVDGKSFPKILDFGSALIWPRKELMKRHEKPLDELIAQDIEHIRNGMKQIYHGDMWNLAWQSFEKIYIEFKERYKEELAPIREKLAESVSK
jgi:hypothetical protein